ncbi:MAG: Asp/Glu racemase [Rhodospirillales bacterium]|nr:Asp/Glu racemase [Rhodospirillales bacterium]MBO6786725.1 Asp/Glu racemase [Rhodospirillales bacterium]
MPLSYDLEIDRGIAMGLIVLQTDELMEFELGKLFLGLGLRVYQNRIPCMPEVRPETLSMMGESMTETAAMLPHEAGISVIGYGCTSGATILGEDRVTTLVQTAHPGVSVTNPLSALKAACASLGVASLGLVSPYVAEVTGALVNALENHGIPISSYGSFEQAEDQTVARISPRSTLDAMLEIGAGDCDAVFASCTNLRAWEIVTEAESTLGKPVLCSNQVIGWHMLRLAGINAPVPGGGRLFDYGLGG